MRKLSATGLPTIVAAALVTLASASVARADEKIVAKVPFDFIVGDSRLPAGAYVVTYFSDNPGVLSIASADGRHSVYTLTVPSWSNQTPGQPELVFEKFENHYFLARVASAVGDEHEIVLTPASMEREATSDSSRLSTNEHIEVGSSR